MADLRVIQPGTKPRPSRMGKWRAMVLILVHVAIGLHVWHWKATGSTVTPVEPSEAMQTLELGYVNAGFVFLGASILSTLILGRWICGWACHLVAMQDLCSWILKKMGIRPKPFRSRLLVWIPVFAAFYMFLYPSLIRILAGNGIPVLRSHFETENFWATFPNWQIATLTIVLCGFLIVLLLGNKGFCTYGCPYGGIFYHADRLAPGRIRATDACNQCGHCTTACTSNIRVHEQVAQFKMVQDPGCMKCLDCVSVCPTNALYYGFGSPLPQLAQRAKPKRVYDFSFIEEGILFAVFVASFYAFRGLYEAIPFLLSIGLSSMNAFLLLTWIRLATKKDVRVQRWQLKRSGRFTSTGVVGALIGALLALGTLHSGIINYHAHEGNRAMNMSAFAQSEANGRDSKLQELADEAERHFSFAVKFGLFPVAEWEYKLGTIAQFRGQWEAASMRFERALELDANRPNTRLQLAHLQFKLKKYQAAISSYQRLLSDKVELGSQWTEFAESLLLTNQPREAASAFETATKQDPATLTNYLNLGMLLAQQSQWSSAIEALEHYVSAASNDARGPLNLGLVYASQGNLKLGLEYVDRSIKISTRIASAHMARATMLVQLDRHEEALQAAFRAVDLEPLQTDVVLGFAQIAALPSLHEKAISRLERQVVKDARFHFAHYALLRSLGRNKEADAVYAEASGLGVNLPRL